jgi:hypothetical protein
MLVSFMRLGLICNYLSWKTRKIKPPARGFAQGRKVRFFLRRVNAGEKINKNYAFLHVQLPENNLLHCTIQHERFLHAFHRQ